MQTSIHLLEKLMKHKHKAYSVFTEGALEIDPLVTWITKNINHASEVMTFMAIPVRLRIEQYLAHESTSWWWN